MQHGMQSLMMGVILAACGAQGTDATVLTFKSQAGLPPYYHGSYAAFDAAGYGDNVSGSPTGIFIYDMTYGDTPDVTLSMSNPSGIFVGGNQGNLYVTNLSNVSAATISGGNTAVNSFFFTTSQTNHPVTLRSFYAGAFVGSPSSYGFNFLEVYLDNSPTPAWSAVPGDLTNITAGKFYAEGVTDGWLPDLLTATNNIELTWGAIQGGSNLAFANIGFSMLPEPTVSVFLAAAGFGWLASRRRR